MRSARTNYLQVAVIVTGVLYMASGLLFAVSPAVFTKLLPISAGDDWSSQIRFDEFLVMMLTYARILSILMFFSGFSMIMPLFDPLKYRSMIYIYGVFFPFFSLLFSSISIFKDTSKSAIAFAGAFAFVFLFNLSGLLLTKKDADMGVE